MKINSKVDFQNLNSELSQENQLLMESSLSSDPTTVSKSFIVVREKKVLILYPVGFLSEFALNYSSYLRYVSCLYKFGLEIF